MVNRLNLALDVAHTRVWDFLDGKRRINRTTIKALGYEPDILLPQAIAAH